MRFVANSDRCLRAREGAPRDQALGRLSTAPRSARKDGGRWPLLLLAWSFFSLGALGLALPGLPTTPFMLLALWGFSKSSPRFERWLYEHPTFGPPLRNWHEHRVIAWRAKLAACTMMALSFAYLWWSGRSALFLLSVGAIMVVGVIFLARFPSK